MNEPHWTQNLNDEEREALSQHDRPITFTEDQSYVLGKINSLVFDKLSVIPRLEILEKEIETIKKAVFKKHVENEQ